MTEGGVGQEGLAHSPGFLALPRVDFQTMARFFYLCLTLDKYVSDWVNE